MHTHQIHCRRSVVAPCLCILSLISLVSTHGAPPLAFFAGGAAAPAPGFGFDFALAAGGGAGAGAPGFAFVGAFAFGAAPTFGPPIGAFGQLFQLK